MPQAVAAEAAERGGDCLVLGARSMAEGLAAGPDLESQPQEGYRSSGGGSPGDSALEPGLEPQVVSERRPRQMDRFVGGCATAAGTYHCRDFAWEEVRRDVEGALGAQLASLPLPAGSGRFCTKYNRCPRSSIYVDCALLLAGLCYVLSAKAALDSTYNLLP